MAENSPLLSGIRVLDLATSRAELAGRLLADLGAEVLKIEPPDGSASRRLPPFDADGESLYWASVGVGKQSVILDLDDLTDRRRLTELAGRADILVESFDPGYMADCGLSYKDLAASNPRLIFISVTPFGQEGPKSGWPTTELTIEAAGGRVGLQGDRDRPPIPVGYPQAAFHAGARAAADAVIALNERELSGLGQRLDTSMLEGVVYSLLAAAGFPYYTGGDPPGSADDRGDEPAARPATFLGRAECADGYVVVTATSNAQVIRAIPATVLPVLESNGCDTTAVAAIDWTGLEAALRENRATEDELQIAFDAVRDFFKLRTRRELIEWAWANDVHLGPSNTTADLLTNPHLLERGYWQEVGSRTQPGLSVRASRTPIVIQRPAPKLDEHRQAVDAWLAEPPIGPTSAASQQERLGEAFAGLKVADFSWVAVGPITAKALSDHGATVVRIESSTRIDYVRTLPPFKDNEPGIDRSHYMANLNSSKLGVALNLRTEEGRLLARRLTHWADVIVENFTPGTMRRLGLDYETLSRDKPDLIMISTCLMGQTGPWASFAGYGPHGAAISGLHNITGWPDRPPVGPYGPYTDIIAPHYAISTLAGAILERRRSGLGQHIDVSQVESAIHFIEPLMLDQIENGRTAPPAGLDSASACPHGVYPTAGTERYIAIAVETAEQWRALCSIAPLEAFTAPSFDALAERQRVRSEIDAAISAWARGWERRELEQALIQRGVPASVVQRMTELVEDPQLVDRGYFVTLDHGVTGPTPYDGLMTRFSAKREMLHNAAPRVGQDTDFVMREILGLSQDEIAEYAVAGVFV